MSEILIAKQTAAATRAFTCDANTRIIPCALFCNGLGTGETVAIEQSDDDGATYSQAYDAAGALVEFNSTRNNIAINNPGKYRINKGTTAAAVGVSLSSANRG